MYSIIRREFLRNLDEILCNFHLKPSSDKTEYIFDHSIWEYNGYFDHWFSNTKTDLCGL